MALKEHREKSFPSTSTPRKNNFGRGPGAVSPKIDKSGDSNV